MLGEGDSPWGRGRGATGGELVGFAVEQGQQVCVLGVMLGGKPHLVVGVKFFFDQVGQFIMCHRPLWAKFNAEYGFRQSQGVHTGCSSRLRPHGFPLGW